MHKVHCSPEVVAGTDKGGEDLFLLFTLYLDHQPDLTEPLTVVPGVGWDKEPNEDDKVQSEFSVETSAYNFKWAGNAEDLVKLVQSAFKNEANWTRSFDGSKYNFKWRYFVDGNAD